MSKLTPLQIFLWKFKEIYTKSNHFAKKKKENKKKQTHGYKVPSFTDPSTTSEMHARSC